MAVIFSGIATFSKNPAQEILVARLGFKFETQGVHIMAQS
jgi:hypothetical protein